MRDTLQTRAVEAIKECRTSRSISTSATSLSTRDELVEAIEWSVTRDSVARSGSACAVSFAWEVKGGGRGS